MFRPLVAWLALMLAEIVHGTLREFYVKPLLGDFRARQLAVFTGSLLLFTLTCAFIKWLRIAGREIQVGLLWVTLTVAFEVSAGRWLAGRSWPDIGSDFALWNGGLLPLGLVVLGLAPLLAARIRR